LARTQTVQVDPTFAKKLKKFGALKIDSCFDCGNCTAICPLTNDSTAFPWKMITYAQLGQEERILESPDPWLCYYCGECSESCPRQAEPAETMMAMRRYLTTRYDWTGVSKAIYTTKWAKYVFAAALSLITVLLVWLLHGPIVTTSVQLTTFAPLGVVHTGGIIFGVILGAILLSNLGRMYWFTVKRRGAAQGKISPVRYIKEFKNVIVQFLTQSRYSRCTSRTAWANHLILMWGYTILFVLYAALLPLSMFNKLPPATDPIKLSGYFAFVALAYSVVYAMVGRIRKGDPSRKFSQATDWMFLILLLLAAVSGILLDAFVGLSMPLAVYVTFTAHLAIVVPLLALEVPFAKWAHLAFRPFGLYFSKLKEAQAIPNSAAGLSSQWQSPGISHQLHTDSPD
jgi:ferredoxin